MKVSFLKSRWFAAASAAAFTAAGMTGARLLAMEEPRPVGARQVFSEALPNVPGKSVTTVTVDFPPGAYTPAHRHPGSVTAYVIKGAVRSQMAGGPPQVYAPGASWFEPPGALHMFAENASAAESAQTSPSSSPTTIAARL